MIKRSRKRLSGLLKVKGSFTAITAAWDHPLELSVKYAPKVSPEVIRTSGCDRGFDPTILAKSYCRSPTSLKNEEEAPGPQLSSPSCDEECL